MTPSPDAVARARREAGRAVGLGQAVPADHGRVLLDEIDRLEATVDEYAGLIVQLTDHLGEGLSVEEFRAKYLCECDELGTLMCPIHNVAKEPSDVG